MEESMNSSVALVLDREFRGSVDELALQMPVWIISSRENDLAVDRARRSLNDPSRVTSLLAVSGENEGEVLLRALYDIEEHHGPPSTVRPYGRIMVYGAESEFVTPKIMNELGLEVIKKYPGGFSLQRRASLI
jgi:hypothetical protein